MKSISQSQKIDLDNNIIEYLNKDILSKSNLIIDQAKKLLRLTHQKKLTKQILISSIQSLNFEKHLIHNDDELLSMDKNDIDDFSTDYISINDYLNESLIDKPLKTMVIYHWFCIEGFSPRTSLNKLDNKKISIPNSKSESNNKITKDNHDLVVKMSKNISKELINFIMNFEKTFHNFIKEEFLHMIYTNDNIQENKEQKNLQINETIIKYEPEIVKIFPMLLDFLEETIKNREIMKIPKLHLIILNHIKAIYMNKYFNLIFYINNIFELVITLLLYSTNQDNENIIKSLIDIKKEIIEFINELMTKYSKYKNEFIISISNFIVPKDNSNFMTLKSYAAIKCINIFGYEYIIKYIYPNIIKFINLFPQNITFKYKNYLISVERNKNKPQVPNINNEQNNIQNSQNNSQSQSSIPLKTFTVPFSMDYKMIPNSVVNMADNSFTQTFLSNNNEIEKTLFKIININDSGNMNLLFKETLPSYLYSEIFFSISIILNEIDTKEQNIEEKNKIKNNIVQIFGEEIIKNIFNK